MPLRPGHSQEIISKNIEEMVKAGHPHKVAIAAALSHARKTKKMAQGGLTESENGDASPEPSTHSAGSEESMSEHMDGDMAPDAPHIKSSRPKDTVLRADSDRKDNRNSRGLQDQASFAERDSVMNPDEQKKEKSLAEAIEEASKEDVQHFAEGGLVQEEYDDEPLGNKPMADGELSWVNDGTEQPMSMMPKKPATAKAPPAPPALSYGDALMNVVMDRKKKRKYK